MYTGQFSLTVHNGNVITTDEYHTMLSELN